MTLRTVLLSLQALLAAAEPDDPQDAVVANQVRWLLLTSFYTCVTTKRTCVPPSNIILSDVIVKILLVFKIMVDLGT
jgi:hypothetical protein